MKYQPETRKALDLPPEPDPEFFSERQELGEFVQQLSEYLEKLESFSRRYHCAPDWDECYKVERHGFDRDTARIAVRHMKLVSSYVEELAEGKPLPR